MPELVDMFEHAGLVCNVTRSSSKALHGPCSVLICRIGAPIERLERFADAIDYSQMLNPDLLCRYVEGRRSCCCYYSPTLAAHAPRMTTTSLQLLTNSPLPGTRRA